MCDMDKKGVLYIGSIVSSNGRNANVPKSFVRKLVRTVQNDIWDFPNFADSNLKSLNFEPMPLEIREISVKINEQENEQDLKLSYTGNGKPYFYDLPLHFSISHTENRRRKDKFYLWGCAVSSLEVGLDMQWIRPVEYANIAKKYFSASEIRYVEERDLDGFFALWTRREAVGKALGLGLSMGKNEFSDTITDGGRLLTHIDLFGRSLEVHTCRMAEDLWGSCCFVMEKEK